MEIAPTGQSSITWSASSITWGTSSSTPWGRPFSSIKKASGAAETHMPQTTQIEASICALILLISQKTGLPPYYTKVSWKIARQRLCL